MIDDGAVSIDDGTIVHVGRRDEVAALTDGWITMDVGGGLITPGLVNTHTHLFQTLLKGLGDDRSLNRWLLEMTVPAAAQLTAADCEVAAMHGAVEAIRSGCTTLVDFMYVHPHRGLTDAVVSGLNRVGVRAIVARGFMTRGTELGVPAPLIETAAEAIADCARLSALHRGDSRIQIGIAPTLLWMIGEEDLRATRAYASQSDSLITYHLAETDFEVAYAAEHYRMSESALLERAGFLGPDLLAAHCTKVSPRDIDLLAEYDVKVSYNPTSNMYLAAGVPPIPAMRSAGVTVGLASDGPASNNNQNMIHVMKAGALLQKVAAQDPTALTAGAVLEMATIGGAQAIGMADRIGSIEPGKRADLAIFLFTNPFVTPVHDPVSALVYASCGSEATTVIVDGRLVMHEGEVTTVDEAALLRSSAAAALSLASRAGLRPTATWR
ncbi:MAG: amidohydrolase [Candidatus Limnocylindria bacterium]